MDDARKVIAELKKQANPRNAAGMARFGITGKNVLGGPSVPGLRKMAKKIGKNHEMARELWASGIHEARLLAAFIDDPAKVTPGQMEQWAAGFDSWDVCDQVCSNLFDKTPYARAKIFKWVKDRREFVKRTGFTLMACLAVHDKTAADRDFLKFFPLI